MHIEAMPATRLGRDGPAVARIGLGCLGLSGGYEPRPDDDEALSTIRRALDLGVTLLDTADMYGAGHNQELIGRAIAGRRTEVFISSKFGNRWDSRGRPIIENGQQIIDGSPDYARAACEASLRRLQTDVIDLYTLHRVDPRIPIEETVGGMAKLIEDGLIRFIGLSEAGPDTLRRAAAVASISALQSEYSLWWREPERSVLPTCRDLGIAYVAYSPLGRGMLTGTITKMDALDPDDSRRNHPRFQDGNLARNLALVAQIEALASRHSCTNAQVALAWLLEKGPDIIPIPGANRRQHLEENAAAVRVRLSSEDVADLESTFEIGAGAGARYPDKDLGAVESQ